MRLSFILGFNSDFAGKLKQLSISHMKLTVVAHVNNNELNKVLLRFFTNVFRVFLVLVKPRVVQVL